MSTLFIVLGSVATWAVLNVVANISSKLSILAAYAEDSISEKDDNPKGVAHRCRAIVYHLAALHESDIPLKIHRFAC